MAGKKGRSGRQVRNIEQKIELVEGYSLAHCIEIYEGTDEKQKFILTKELAGKVLSRRVNLSGKGFEGHKFIVMLGNGQSALNANNNQTQAVADRICPE